MRKEYQKLIRDRIPEIIRDTGRECEVEVMSDAEYCNALWQKLLEEAAEGRDAAQTAPQRVVTELADLYEVVDAILATYEISRDEVLEEQVKRRKERGGFSKQLRLLWAE